jgi:glutamate dehydrogenase/leucine dehydrogenase
LVDHVAATGSVVEFPGSEPITNEELLELRCDILMPAALGEVITQDNVDRIHTRAIIEAANHPVVPIADQALADRGVIVVPDILANAGGVTVSYFEWVQNNQELQWEEAEVNDRLTKIMRRAYQECRAFQQSDANKAETLREAAFALAVERVVEAATLRGYL